MRGRFEDGRDRPEGRAAAAEARRKEKSTNTQSPSSWVGCLSPDSMCEGVDCGEYDLHRALARRRVGGQGGGPFGANRQCNIGVRRGAGAASPRRTAGIPAPRRNSGTGGTSGTGSTSLEPGPQALPAEAVTAARFDRGASRNFRGRWGTSPAAAGALPKFPDCSFSGPA